MFTLHDTFLKRMAGYFLPICLAMGFCAGIATKAHAQFPPAPGNDNLASAQGITDASGTVNGENMGATTESGEFTPDNGAASIWYIWTAPVTTTIDFSTLGSTDDNGNPLDTILVMYSLKAGATNLTYGNLKSLATNDNDPSGGVTSRVDLPVTVGQTYLIQVLGSPSNNVTGYPVAEGNVELSWSSSLVAGAFGFSTSTYYAGEFDDTFLVDYLPNSISQSLHNADGTNNIRVTVTRQGGGVGKCQVTLSLTNVTYTNLFQTNYSGTNIYMTYYSTNVFTSNNIIAYTNTGYLVVASQNIYTNYVGTPSSGGGFQGFPTWNVQAVTQTNFNPTSGSTSSATIGPMVTNSIPLTGLGLTNFFANWPAGNQLTVVSNTNGPFSIIITQIFNLGTNETNQFGQQIIQPYISTNYTVPSASNGLDYISITTNLTFNDFQMSQDVYLYVNPGVGILPGPDSDLRTMAGYFGINSLVLLSLSNPQLAPGEDPNILPPTLATGSDVVPSTNSNAYLDILNFYCNPNNYFESPEFLVTNTSVGTYATINLERATFRCNRVPDGSGDGFGTNAFLYLYLAGSFPSTATYTLHYTIDNDAAIEPGFNPIPVTPFDYNEFATVAGSDYAVPYYYTNGGNLQFPDFGQPVNTPLDPTTLQVGKNTTWTPGGLDGEITIGPFNPGQPYGLIAIPILTNGAVEFDQDMIVQLYETPSDYQANTSVTFSGGQPAPAFLGNISCANLTINFTGQPGGCYDTNWNLDSGGNKQPGATPGAVEAIALQPNGQAIIGGSFEYYDEHVNGQFAEEVVYGIARLQTNGYLDPSFSGVTDSGVGRGNSVSAIAIDSSGRIIIGGSFSSYDNLPNTVNNIARLNSDGTLDTSFNTGTGFSGGPVTSLAIDANGNILVGGDFTSYNTTNVNYIVRLLPGGGLDPSFIPNTGNGLANFGTDAAVETVATDGNGNIILGGDFANVNGVNLNYVARLLPTGAVDPSFASGIGPDLPVNSVAIAPNNEILIGGEFQSYNSIGSPGVALLAYNGSLDTTFVPGDGADGPVYTVGFQTNGDVLVGGQFRNFNNVRRLGVARLLPNGWVDTSFMDTAYNQFAGLINKATTDPVNEALALAVQSDGNILVGGSFTNIGGGATRDSVHTQLNITRLIGAPTAGPQTGGGGIANCPGNITMLPPYSTLDTIGSYPVGLARVNGSLGPAQVTLSTNLLPPGSGDASAADLGLQLPSMPVFNDYRNVYPGGYIIPYGTYGWRQSDGFYGTNNSILPSVGDRGQSSVSLNIYNDPSAAGDLLADLALLAITSDTTKGILSLGGVPIPSFPALGLPASPLNILNNNINPGVIGFNAANYTALDTSNKVTLTVVRTNGSYGTINFQYYTANGSAVSPNNYTGVAQGKGPTLSFSGGSGGNTSDSFTINITPQTIVQPTTTFKVFLSGGGGTINSNYPPYAYPSATVTIEDGNFSAGHLSFTASTYTNSVKGEVVTVGVMRTGGAQGQLSVQCGTSDGTATNGINYTGVTNTLNWGVGDVSVKTMSIQTLQDNTEEGTKTVILTLSNPTNTVGLSNSQILTTPSIAVLNLQNNDFYGGLTFVANNFNVFQNAGQALITVTRTNGTTGTISVNYTNFSDTNATNLGPNYSPAVAGTNFGATNGTLTFGPGVTSQSFVVPVYYTPNDPKTNSRLVTLQLFGPSPIPGVSGTFPITAYLTILDPRGGSELPGSVDARAENYLGTGFNNIVDSLALQPDGFVLAGGDFTYVDNFAFNYVTRLQTNAQYDSSFLGTATGGDVLQVLSQNPVSSGTDGPILIAGNFTNVDGVNRGRIARLNVDGSLDETFNPGSGADGTILAVAETSLAAPQTNQPPTLAYYVAGDFGDFNGVSVGGIARLNASTNSPGAEGNLDPTFNVLQGVTSGSGGIHAVAVQANGQVLLGGDFTAFNSLPYNHMVRLNIDGSVDPSFLPNTNYGPMDAVRSIAIQPDGQILIGGLFTNVGGSNLNYLARLNGTDGSVDPTFNPQGGGNNAVLALALDSQNRILVGGEFTRFGGVSRDGITRLNTNGTVDPTIDFGSGADGGFVDTLVIDANDEIDVGGGFSSFEGVPENNFVRLFGLSTMGDGNFGFNQESYGVTVAQSGTNAIVTIQRQGPEGTNAQTGVTLLFSTSDGTPAAGFQSGQAGVDYTMVSTNVTFPYGEVFETVSIPILPSSVVGSNKDVNLNLAVVSPTNAGILISPIAYATLYITNNNSAVSFGETTSAQSANVPGGDALIPVVRVGNTNSTVGVTVSTGTGTATPNVVYTPTTNFLVFNPGVTTNYFLVPMLNPSNLFSDVNVPLALSNPSNTIAVSPTTCLLTIDGSNGPGVISFAQPSYSVLAPTSGQSNALITINETENLNNTVSVVLTTSNGTAIAGQQYASVSQTNFFSDQSNAVVNIPIYPQDVAGPATTVLLTLSGVQGGATIAGATQEVLTILNGIESVTLTNLPYTVNESNNTFIVEVARGGPATNTAVSVNYYTYTPPNTTEGEGYAQPNVDYTPVSGTLTLGPGVSATSFSIPILQANSVNPNPITFEVGLNTPSPTNIQVGPTAISTISIVGDVTGFEFSSSNYFIGENGSNNLVINVNRLNAGTGTATVKYATSDGTNANATLNASNTVDYTSTSGTLTFANGQTTASFVVPILNRNIVEGNKTFNVTLSTPQITIPNSAYTNAYLVSPSSASVTITNVLAGVSFGSPTYNVSECGAEAAIPVVLTGVANNNVSVTFSTTTGGSAVPGLEGNYLPVTNTVTFTNGQTVVTNYVQILNNHIIGPNHTVYLALTGVTGAQLLNPSTAVLTIDECNGAYIVGSGTAFVSGNVSPGSGVLFPNETVTVLLGLRDIAGSNTTHLVATLQATNGVANVSGPQTYGVLITNGATVSRPFTFEAVGTNGQNISANLALQDGSQVYSNVDFGFTLGGVSTTFSNKEILHIFGSNNPPSKASSTNAPNYGYPSIINVSGVVGTVTGVSAGINNFGHTYPSDVAVVLAGPSGSNTLLMEDCGYTNAVSGINLTFSQTAGSSLPEFSAMTSGTFLPTGYGDQEPLPTSTNGASVPLRPFQTSLNSFVGQPANGTWSLFVADDDTLDSGYISNGWFVTISTGVPIGSDSDLEMTMSSPATALVSNTMAYTIIVSNAGPATATNVLITDTLPTGMTYAGSSCGCTVGTNGLANGVLTFSFATLAVSNQVTVTLDVVPNVLGSLTNSAEATSDQIDLNDNNGQTNVVLVSTPSADLGVTLTDLPASVINGSNVTYTIVVTNGGPATATGVVATNVLPVGFILVTNLTQATSGTVSNSNGTNTWTLGSMGNGSSATLTLVAVTAVPTNGNYLDSVTVGSPVYDPTKANNFASVKTGVTLPPPVALILTHGNNTYTVSWPASIGFILEGSTNLPAVWVPITNSSVTQQVFGSVTSNLFSLPGTNGYHFFRLKQSP